MEGANFLPIGEDEYKEVAWTMKTKDSKHEPIWIPRGNCGDEHIKFELLFSGVCHSDCHSGYNDLGGTVYPFVGGHEMCGRVVEVGKKVTLHKVGDIVGVGCMVDSCLNCKNCELGDENYCLN